MQHALNSAAASSHWAAWDDPAETRRFVMDDVKAGLAQARFAVDGLHCAACAGKLEAALLGVPGVLGASVSAAARTAEVNWRPGQCQPSALAEASMKAGYGLIPLGDPALHRARSREGRLALWRWLVAVFSMMQVMMYTSPTYFTAPGEIGEQADSLLRWAAWVLSLPVVLFSAKPFFAQAWRDARQGRVGMDTPVAIGIAITFAMGTLSAFEPSGPWGHELYLDSLTMFVAFLLTGRWLEARLHHRTAGALEALSARLPTAVRRERGGQVETVPLSHLQPGEVLLVATGEAFAADGCVLEGTVMAEEALLTGESAPVARAAGQEVVAGSLNLGAPARVQVLRVGSDTRYAAIVALMQQAQTDKPRAAQLADRWAPAFLLAVLVSAALAAAWWWPVDPVKALTVAVAVLIVTCPCALSLATPAALLSAAGALARRGILVRRLAALERLADVNHFVFDKTGTACTRDIRMDGLDLADDVPEALAWSVASELASQSSHPVSKAIALHAQRQASSAPRSRFRDVAEVPGLGVEGIDQAGRRWRLGQPAWVGTDASGGYPGARVALACAQPEGHGWHAPKWVASFRLGETVHPDMAATAQRLSRSAHVELVSGDREAAVAAVARELGLSSFRADARPADKLAHVRASQQAGDVVAMVGDGLNDGPTLAHADVSFAMGEGVAVAKTSSDFIIQSGNPADVAWAHDLAQRTRKVIRQNLAWAAMYNAACVPLALMGWLPPWAAGLGMATSSLLVVLNALRLNRG
jgi:Cu2+-exporting ATPase